MNDSSTKVNLHAQIELIPAAGLLTSWLANYWLGRAFSVGENYMDYVQKGTQDVDLKFLEGSNDGINHVYGFDKYEIPTVAFKRYVDAYIWCVAENQVKSINPPFDLARPLEEAAQWRKDFQPKAQRNDDFDGDVMNDSMKKLLATLTESLTHDSNAKSYPKRLQVIDFVVSEIQPMLQLSLDQIDKDRGFSTEEISLHDHFVDAESLDDLMPEEDQDRLLGHCYRRGDDVYREGLRGTYAVAVANLKRAMYNDEQRRELSGIYYDTLTSWVHLMRLGHTQSSEDDKE